MKSSECYLHLSAATTFSVQCQNSSYSVLSLLVFRWGFRLWSLMRRILYLCEWVTSARGRDCLGESLVSLIVITSLWGRGEIQRVWFTILRGRPAERDFPPLHARVMHGQWAESSSAFTSRPTGNAFFIVCRLLVKAYSLVSHQSFMKTNRGTNNFFFHSTTETEILLV